MSKKMNIWGREFDIQIRYEAYDGEEVLPSQIDALNSFVDGCDELLSEPDSVIKYCLTNNTKEIKEPIKNIFKYVMPVALLILRSSENNVVLLCNYKFDYENGLALVFNKNELIKICSQSEI